MKYPDINIQMKYPNKLINADTPKVTKSEHFPKNRVVRHPERTLLISIGDVDDVNGVAEKRDAVSLDETQQHHIVRPSFGAKNGVERAVEGFDTRRD